MKFSQIFATLLVISSAFAIDEYKGKEIVEICYDELNDYDECYPKYAEVTEKELQDNCNAYKSEKCQNYWDDPIKFVPTCSKAIGYRSISRLNEMDIKRAHYDEICAQKTQKTDDEVQNAIVKKCQDELKDFEECFVKYEDVSEDELRKNCENYKMSRKCAKFWNYPFNFIPSCYEDTGKGSVFTKDEMDKKRVQYEKICTKKTTKTDDEIEEIEKKCQDGLKIYEECFVKYSEDAEELQKSCNNYKYTRKCNRFWSNPFYYITECYEDTGKGLNSMKNEMDSKRAQYDEICTPKSSKTDDEIENAADPVEKDENEVDPAEEIVNKCYDELKEYEHCYPKYGDVSEDELRKNCQTYKYTRMCQKFWNDPLNFVPSCSEAIGYRSISMLNDMDLKRAHYDEICTPKTTKTDEEIKEIEKKCQDELKFYQECFVKYSEDAEELQKSCNDYKYTRKCNRFWSNPFYYIPECYEDIGKGLISMNDEMNSKRAQYDEICLNLSKKTTTVIRKTTTVVRTTTTTKNVPKSTVDGICGEGYGACAEGYCCSRFGYCGKSESYCGTGCQPKYGICQ